MKRLTMVLAGGMFVLLLTAAGMKNNVELLDEHTQESEYFDAVTNEYLIDYNHLDIFKNPDKDKTIKVGDIKVYEVEEAVVLGFDTLDYLPMGFNPVEGSSIQEQLDYEEEFFFERIFKDVEAQETLKIEDIVIYEKE